MSLDMLVTVITPIFNGEDFLSACIESVIGQSYSNWELLLIDDGSTDGSGEICRHYAEMDERIHYISRPHLGVSAARNTGLEQAKGAYISFLDCDDMIHPLLIEKQLELVQKYDVSLVVPLFSTVGKTFQLPKNLQTEKVEPKARYLPGESLTGKIPGAVYQRLIGIGGKLFLRDALKGIRFPEELTQGEDTIFVFYALSEPGISAAVLRHKWYYRRRHENNVTNIVPSLDDYSKYFQCLDRGRQKWWKEFGTAGIWESRFYSILFECYICSRLSHLPQPQIETFRQSLLAFRKESGFQAIPFKVKAKVWIGLKSVPVYLQVKAVWSVLKKALKGSE